MKNIDKIFLLVFSCLSIPVFGDLVMKDSPYEYVDESKGRIYPLAYHRTLPHKPADLTCLKATVPNPRPLPNETTDFYGSCEGGKAFDGIVVWKQNDEAFNLTCLIRGEIWSNMPFYSTLTDQWSRETGGDDQSVCMRYLKFIPNFCKSAGWTGQCKDGKPHGIGKNELALSNKRRVYIGQANEGVISGIGTESAGDGCSSQGCTGHLEYWSGWWVDGSRNFRCKEGLLGCRAEFQAKADRARKEAEVERSEAIAKLKREKNKENLVELVKATKCEEAEQFVERQPEQERPYFAKKSCLDERRHKTLEQSQNPQEIYLGAVKFESDGERSRAKYLYELIMEKFSASPIALKAADRLAALVDVEAISRSNASKEQAVRDANQAAEKRQAEFERNRSAEKVDASQSCRSRISSCNNSCDPIRDNDQRYACRSGCESICTK
jgi:hypothetical protein